MDVILRVVGIVLRILGVLLAFIAARNTYYAMWFRLEGSDELEMIVQADLVLGAAFAVALLLFFTPDCRWNPRAWVRAIIAAAVIWTCISGFLIESHRQQHRIRSSQMFLRPAE